MASWSSRKERFALVAATALVLFWIWTQHTQWSTHRREIAAGLAVTLAFAVLARLSRGVDASGALAGAAVAFVLASADLRLFWILLIVFVLTLAATRAGTARKTGLRRRESKNGRSAAQVMANLGIATALIAFSTLIAVSISQPVLPAIAALAELAADTCSSEMGMALPGTTILITTWKRVAAGTDGGISIAGSLAGCIAAMVVAGAAYAFGLAGASHVLPLAFAGICGMLFDSGLGALLERPGMLGNHSVNLLGTAAAAIIMWLIA